MPKFLNTMQLSVNQQFLLYLRYRKYGRPEPANLKNLDQRMKARGLHLNETFFSDEVCRQLKSPPESGQSETFKQLLLELARSNIAFQPTLEAISVSTFQKKITQEITEREFYLSGSFCSLNGLNSSDMPHCLEQEILEAQEQFKIVMAYTVRESLPCMSVNVTLDKASLEQSLASILSSLAKEIDENIKNTGRDTKYYLYAAGIIIIAITLAIIGLIVFGLEASVAVVGVCGLLLNIVHQNLYGGITDETRSCIRIPIDSIEDVFKKACPPEEDFEVETSLEPEGALNFF